MTPAVQKWIDFINGEVAIFVPYADRFSVLAKHPNGRYEASDCSYRFPLSNAKIIIDNLPPGFRFSDEFLDAIANDDATDPTPLPVVKIEKRVELLPDEHQDRMIAVLGLPEFSHDENFSKVFNLTVCANQSTKRVEILLDAHPDEMVAIYAPYNHIPTLHGILRLKAHYVSDDQSWRCSITVIDSVREAFPSPEYHHSEEFLRQLEPIDCGF